jgi:hypothetical protein
MWSEKKLYLTGAVAILAFSGASMSAASAKHLRAPGKSGYTVSAQKKQAGETVRARSTRRRPAIQVCWPRFEPQ